MGTILKRTRSDGSTFYLAQVRRAGNPNQSSTFSTKADAKRWVVATEAELDAPPAPAPQPPAPQVSLEAPPRKRGRPKKDFNAGIVPNPSASASEVAKQGSPKKEKHLLSEAIDRYMREVMPLKSAPEGPTQQLSWWRSRLGTVALDDITPMRLAQHKSYLLSSKTTVGKKRSNATVNRYLAVLSHVFTVAIKEWFWIEDNPLHKVQKLREPPGRVRFLTDDERERLIDACKQSNPALIVVVTLAIYTGMRYGEIMGLRWRNVDFIRNRITLEKTKNKERRGVPMSGPALSVLTKWMDEHPDTTPKALVFPGTTDASKPIILKKMYERAVQRAGIENFHFHDLRHCTASYLAMSGATTQEIAEVLGHKTLQMVHRYSHLAETRVRGVLERMATKYGTEAGDQA